MKIAGMLAAAIIVVGGIVIVGNSSVGTSITGTSASATDVATGNILIVSTESYDDILDKLGEYFADDIDQATKDRIVQDSLQLLQSLSE